MSIQWRLGLVDKYSLLDPEKHPLKQIFLVEHSKLYIPHVNLMTFMFSSTNAAFHGEQRIETVDLANGFVRWSFLMEEWCLKGAQKMVKLHLNFSMKNIYISLYRC